VHERIEGAKKNIPNIRDSKTLQTFEQRATALRLDEALAAIKGKPLTLLTWQKLHQILFQDVYPRAGEIRKVQLAKGNTVSVIPEHIRTQAKEIFDRLQTENLSPLNTEAQKGFQLPVKLVR